MMPWEMWKQGFNAWEKNTTVFMERMMKNPLVLGPSGALLTAVMKAKVASDKAVATWWGSLGLPTKRDQERTLHALNQLQSRLLDLEERLADAEQDAAPAAKRTRGRNGNGNGNGGE